MFTYLHIDWIDEVTEQGTLYAYCIPLEDLVAARHRAKTLALQDSVCCLNIVLGNRNRSWRKERNKIVYKWSDFWKCPLKATLTRLRPQNNQTLEKNRVTS